MGEREIARGMLAEAIGSAPGTKPADIIVTTTPPV
jgi:hypothetical protein